MQRIRARLHIVAALLLTAAATPSHAALILHYDFESQDGTNRGTGGSTYDAVVANGSPNYATSGGPSGTYVELDGNDMFRLTKLPTGYTDWTQAFWIRTTDTALYGGYQGTPQVPVFGDTTNGIYVTAGVDGGKPALHYYDSAWNEVLAPVTVADGAWHHIAMVYLRGDPNDGVGTLQFYVDGSAVGSPVTVTQLDGSGYGIESIGGSYETATTQQHANAAMDDLRYYDNALSAAEIAQLAGTVPEPGPLALHLLALAGVLLIRKR